MSENENTFCLNVDRYFYSSKEQAKKYTGAIVNRMKTKNQQTKATARLLAEAVTSGLWLVIIVFNLIA